MSFCLRRSSGSIDVPGMLRADHEVGKRVVQGEELDNRETLR